MQGIALALTAGFVVAYLARTWRFPAIPFYIIIGIVLGATGLNVIHESETAAYLGHIGLLFLLFTMGLHLRPHDVLARRRSFVRAGSVDFGVNFAIGLIAAFLLGLPLFEAVVIAAAFYISSSAMALSSLIENRKLGFPESETVVWMMVFEDIVLVLFIVLLAATQESPLSIIIMTIQFVAASFLLVYFLKDPLRRLLSRDDEVPLLFVVAAVILAAYLSNLAGVPDSLTVIALGSAFSMVSHEAPAAIARPFREVFMVLFFVFFGVSVQFTGALSPLLLLGLGVLAISSKLFSGIIIGRLSHRSTLSGVEIWSDTAARGEFSIALAALYGSVMVSSTVAALVVITGVVGGFTGMYSPRIRSFLKKGKGTLQRTKHSTPAIQFKKP
ncbi:MAG TPA: cation:proton antiporter [Methanoculleus sp.]|nr:cation:proton antiporter [Methanoculleus sp.]